MTPTLEQRIQNLEDAITRIEATLGDWTTPPLLSQGKTPSELPNQRYNLKESDFQVHTALDALLGKGGIIEQIHADITAIAARPAGSVQVPSGSVDVQSVIAAFAAMGIKIGATVHAPLIIESKNGVGIYLRSDTDNTTGQRDPGTTYPQWFGIALSGDGGGGLFQNIIYPEDGTQAYIPDPTREAVTWRLDRMKDMSVDVMRAGTEFAPGRFEVISNLGQCFVFRAEFDGNMTLRMPQENSALWVEGGYGGNAAHVDGAGNPQGHRETKFRKRVALEGGWP